MKLSRFLVLLAAGLGALVGWGTAKVENNIRLQEDRYYFGIKAFECTRKYAVVSMDRETQNWLVCLGEKQ
jgi:hypothetical protein